MTSLAASSLSHDQLTALFLGIGLLLALARILGEAAKYFGQPVVLGEILAGVLLGKTLLHRAFPGFEQWLFPHEGPAAVSLSVLTTLGISLFLLVAGMEVDLSTVWRQGRSALVVALVGIAVPFSLGFAAGYAVPGRLGMEPGKSRAIFALFIATAMSITALPVIAKILMDLQLFRSDVGMVVVAAAIINDVAGWLIFAFLLGLMGAAGEGGPSSGHAGPPIWFTITMTLAFAFGMLTVGRFVVDRLLPFMQAHLSWPGGIIGMGLAVALLCAALTEWIGVHAIFGAFIFGIALGDSRHLRARTRATLAEFISFFFAPLFFASIGLQVDFIADFNLPLVLFITVLATVGKVFGCWLAARWTGFRTRESWAVGFGMNARGAMEIILGLLAMEAGVIKGPLFVALVVMALATSVSSGMVMQRLLATRRPVRFLQFLTSLRFAPALEAADRYGAIRELVQLASADADLDPAAVEQRVVRREKLMSSAAPNGLAMPTARVPGLAEPVVAVGISKTGLDFDARDGQPTRVICLLLTPMEDTRVQRTLLADVTSTLGDPALMKKLAEAQNYTEFLATLRSEGPLSAEHRAAPPPAAEAEAGPTAGLT